ncbi:MAG: ADP-ribosylglycohydrolase family protein [Woeseiaceae bacterium]
MTTNPESDGHDTVIIDRSTYRDKLRGFWLGSSIANWTGLPTENVKFAPPFFTDDDWGTRIGRDGEVVNIVLDNRPWGADDDTDIEYVYQSALERHNTFLLTPEQIAAAWTEHVGLPSVWVSNLAALGQMQQGVVPPATSLPENNPMWEMIDAQLTTEIFGALAPVRPDVALKIAHLPIRTTAYQHSEWAAEFYVIMYSLVSAVDASKPRAEQLQWMAAEARKRLPAGTYIADMYDFVWREYQRNPAPKHWAVTRDKIYQRYQLNTAARYRYKYPWDSGINFAASLVSLFYGEGDFRNTIRIGTLAGWDSDNPTATWGGLLGLMMGHSELEDYFDKHDFSDEYEISRTRFGFPATPDTFSAMAERALPIIDQVVVDAMGGRIANDQWLIPVIEPRVQQTSAIPVDVRWETIEDADPRWDYSGFITRDRQWNASGATLTTGLAGCRATITFSGTAVQYYAFRGNTSGQVSIILDGRHQGTFSLSTQVDHRGQFYAKIFERFDLLPGEHTLGILCDDTEAPKSIDMLSVIPN